ncbi:MAG: hypothetical protein JF615_17235 [Asticcacaulis sp.]|nr:hypothetical protein [Asticcacaulis sp.]
MDTIIRTNSGTPLITPWSARGMSNDKYAVLQKADAHKRELQTDVNKAFDNPSFKIKDDAKNRIRQRLEEIGKRLKVLKKLFAGNPKEMAKALKQVFKELRAALKEYKQIMKDEIGMSAGAAASVVPSESDAAPSATTADAGDGDKAAKDDKTDDAAAEKDEPVADTTAKAAEAGTEAAPKEATTDDTGDKSQTQAQGTVSYDEVVGAMRKSLGEDGIRFVKDLMGMVKEIDEKMLTPARIQMKAQKPNKETDKAFEEVDKELKELREDMQKMQDDIKRDVPTVGMRLDIAA